MLQDHRGYIWIGTFGGLARFDGERFTVFDSSNTPGFGSDQIFSLYESRSGALWIGSVDGGVIRMQDGVATTYTERDGLPNRWVTSIRGDLEGKVWINTAQGGVAHFVGTQLEAYPTHRGKAVREFFLQARDRSMWFRCGQDVARFAADGSVATLHSSEPSVFLVHEARDGSVWIVLRDQYRLVRYYDGVFSAVPLPPLRPSELAPQLLLYSFAMTEDADGELLLRTPAGVSRILNGRLSPPEALPLPANGELLKVRSLLVDREGNLWVGTVGMGLIRLRRAPLTAYGKDEGLSDSNFSSAFQDREGRIWLGGDLLYWFDGHRFHRFPGLGDILSVAQTRDGDLWFGGYGGLYRWRAGVLSHFDVNAPAVKIIFQDREGTLWIGAMAEDRPGGLYRFRNEKLEQVPGISDVRAIAEDRDGGLWLGGLAGLRYMRGSKIATYDRKQGLSSNSVDDILQDSTGTLWVATYGGGLNRLRNGRFKAITTQDGLPDNLLLGILEDDKGNLWFSSNQSVFRLSLKELNDFADGKISFLSPVSYGIAEGMRSTESNGGFPAGWQTNDGRIWFPTLRGVVAIDPAAGDRIPPPVMLEEARANEFTLAPIGRTSLSPGNNTFDFRFTALSFSAPEKLRFKYRLDPFDKDWVDAGTRRTAHYTNMDPGEYSFRVLAVNNFGIWSDQEASVRFVLLPHFYQTGWFRTLCAAIFLALLWAAYQLRVRQLHQKHERLRANEALLRLTIDTIPAHVWSARPDGSLDFINQRWLDFSGLTLEQGLGWGWEAAIHREDREQLVDTWRAAIVSGKAMEVEARMRRTDGNYRWLLIRNVPLHDKAGRIVKWYGTSTDVDGRKHAEEAVRRTAAYLQETQRLTHTGTFVADNTTKPLYWSEELFRIFGFDPQLGLPTREQPLERIHPEDLDKFWQAWQRSIHDKVDADVEYRIVLPDGTLKHAYGLGHPVLNAHGELVEIVGTTVDITERKRAEEALHESETRFRTFVDHAGDALFVYDVEQRIVVDVNRSACESVGYTRQEMIGNTPFAFHLDSYQAEMESIAERAVAGGTVIDRHWHRRKDGTTFPVEVHTSLVSYGGRRFLLMVARDISDRLQAEEQRERLRQLEADLAHINRVSMMGELTASIAHEVNQPLSGVVSNGGACLRWLAGDVPNLEEAREAARRIVRDGKRAGEIITRIRALTRRTAVPREQLDLNETIREVLALVGDQAKRNNVMIRTQFADDVFSVLGDRVQLQQVVLNLIMNSIEAMSSVEGRGRELAITTQNTEADQVLVKVEDSGIGIDPQTVDKIFDSFYTTKSGGMGMGLSVSRSILQAHGGRLWATAKDGKGTIFNFTLPKYHKEEANAGVVGV